MKTRVQGEGITQIMAWESHLQFRIIDGEFETDRIYSLTQQQIDIGRLPRDYEPKENELLFREPTLSRVHATLTWKPRKGCYEMEHKSDVNSTLVDGKSIKKKMLLVPGDRIQMGRLILELEEARAYTQKEARGARASTQEERAETLRKLHAIVAEVQQEFSHVKFDDGPQG